MDLQPGVFWKAKGLNELICTSTLRLTLQTTGLEGRTSLAVLQHKQDRSKTIACSLIAKVIIFLISSFFFFFFFLQGYRICSQFSSCHAILPSG